MVALPNRSYHQSTISYGQSFADFTPDRRAGANVRPRDTSRERGQRDMQQLAKVGMFHLTTRYPHTLAVLIAGRGYFY